MNDILSINVSDIIGKDPYSKSYRDELIIIELTGERFPKEGVVNKQRLRFESLSFILSCQGVIDINISEKDYHFTTQVLLDISEMHVIKSIKLSPDFRGYHILMSKSFQMETMRGFKPLSASKLIERYNYPVELMREGEGEMLIAIVEEIKNNIARTTHFYQREIIKNQLRKFFIESLNITMCRSKEQEEKTVLSKEEIVVRFIHLLTKHCKEEHSVAFYARKLCIDSRYLSRILKKFGGKPANSWIDDALIKEAKLYLHEQDLTIGQVTDILNFSDQSAFGKFFKKHSGMSPLNYRRTLL